MLYSFSLLVWLGIYFFFIFPRILKKHPNVGETTHLVVTLVLTFVFAAWAIKFLRILLECVSECGSAPSIAYSLNDEGVKGVKKQWFISWEDIDDVASIIGNEGFYFHTSKKSGYSMNSWGIDPEEMRQAKTFIIQKLPKSKTVRLW